jgi:hypothetical protein
MKKNAVIIELKQWTETLDAEGDNEVSVHWGIEYRDSIPLHRSANMLPIFSSVHTAFQSNISLSACAYLHNYIYNDKVPY